MYGVEVGNHFMWVYGPAIAVGWPQLAPDKDPGFWLTSQIWANRCGGNGMMMDPYPHPQHMKVVNHLSYVWSGSGNHLMWVHGLNHSRMASINIWQGPRISAHFPNLGQQVWWKRHDDGSISPSTAYGGCESPFICM